MPARVGRPIALTAEALLAFYHQYADRGPRGIVLEWTLSEVARHLRVSTHTIWRRERELIAAGTIRRQLSDDRQRSFVILSPATWDGYAQGMQTRCAETRLPEAGSDVRYSAAASEGAIPAALPPAPAQASRTCAEETHHGAAEDVARADRGPPGDRTTLIGSPAACARGGVSLQLGIKRVIADRLE